MLPTWDADTVQLDVLSEVKSAQAAHSWLLLFLRNWAHVNIFFSFYFCSVCTARSRQYDLTADISMTSLSDQTVSTLLV